MNYRKAILTALVCGLLCAGSLPPATAFAAEKPEYLKSVTYFGDEWPINYWNSEDKNIDANLTQIAADGFNSIILVVPWKEFQPLTLTETYNQKAFDRLESVMEHAQAHGLWVTLRLGYTWDYYGSSGLAERFENIFTKDSQERGQWLEYSKKIYETVSRHENFYGAFITWEDFWDFSYTMKSDDSLSTRVYKARKCGYTDYLSGHYTIEEVSARYGETFDSFRDVYIPYRKSPAVTMFYEYYNQSLMDILHETQQVFPELSMEVRTDGDRVYDAEGHEYGYSHAVTFPCDGAPYSAMMYTVSMSQANNGNRISAETALAAMEQNMAAFFTGSGGKKYYMEQLLYMDSTESVSQNTKLYDDQVDDYILNVSPILNRYTMGYGLWVYRNYVNNGIYNAQFALGTDGWNVTGGVRIEEHNGTPMAYLMSGAILRQDLSGRLPDGKEVYVRFYAEPDPNPTTVTVTAGGSVSQVSVTGPGVYGCTIPAGSVKKFSLTAGSGVYIDDIKVYTYVQEGRIRDVDGSEKDLAGAFRELNAQLDRTAADRQAAAVPETAPEEETAAQETVAQETAAQEQTVSETAAAEQAAQETAATGPSVPETIPAEPEKPLIEAFNLEAN